MADAESLREIEWTDADRVVDGLETEIRHRIRVKREAIPVIFVPGIMGSRLRNRRTGQIAWDPDDSLFMVRNYLATGPKEKKETMIGTGGFDSGHLEVAHDDAAHTGKHYAAVPGAGARGWSGVLSSSYGPILKRLHGDLEKSSFEFRRIFAFPVYAFGYNWTGSCYDAGRALAARIDAVIAENARERLCERVILVTHSMGGLVSRSAVVLHGAASKVAGIVHGVQPVTGAPAAYWRMKCGFERPGPFDVPGRIAAIVLGADGRQVTALLGNMPGGLQLLPNADYRTNDGARGWLAIPAGGGRVRHLPEADPYTEIYMQRDEVWRLVDPAWLDPGSPAPAAAGAGGAGGRSRGADEIHALAAATGAWPRYLQYLAHAKAFHTALGLRCHPLTCAFYGSGTSHPTAHTVTYKFTEMGFVMRAGKLIAAGAKAGLAAGVAGGVAALVGGGAAWLPVGAAAVSLIMSSDAMARRGGFREYVAGPDGTVIMVEIGEPDGAGDGTVPESSGNALSGSARTVPGHAAARPGAAHEPSYKDSGCQAFTLDAVRVLCVARYRERKG